MKIYQIWSEGYRATGESSGAVHHGQVKAKNFKEACDIKFKGERIYNSKNLTLWGCQLFDNQIEAIKNFG